MKRHGKILKNYVSPIDERLAEFDRTHRLSPSQQAEIKKYEEVYKRRDKAVSQKVKKDIWQF